jgi:hypothetical protein
MKVAEGTGDEKLAEYRRREEESWVVIIQIHCRGRFVTVFEGRSKH